MISQVRPHRNLREAHACGMQASGMHGMHMSLHGLSLDPQTAVGGCVRSCKVTHVVGPFNSQYHALPKAMPRCCPSAEVDAHPSGMFNNVRL